MSKEHNFTASDVLTPELMNKLTQDSQIVSDSQSDKSASDDRLAKTKWVRSAVGDTSLNAASANKLKTARKIKIVDARDKVIDEANFDGTESITLKLPDILGVDTLRRVTLTWRKESSPQQYYVAASAEVICHKDFITWVYDDKELTEIGISGIDAEEITVTQLNAFLKKLGYGGRGTFYLGAKQERMLPMQGESKFLQNNDNIQSSDIIAGVYPDRENSDKLYYLTAQRYTTSGLNNATICAAVRRIV